MRPRPSTPSPQMLLLGLSVAMLAGVGGWLATRTPRACRPFGRRGATMPALRNGRGFRVERTATVLRSPEELYAEWRDLGIWPKLVPHLESVTQTGGNRSHWVARGPGGMPVEWDAELVSDEPGRRITWRAVDSPDVDHAGSVQFFPAPNGRGTEVKVVLTYAPPAGQLGDVVATVFGASPDRQLREGLRHFKQRMEAHEVATSGTANREGDRP
jgi:uncharacterized membrane protein